MTNRSSLELEWFDPVAGDLSSVETDINERVVDVSHVRQVAAAAAALGFTRALIPVGAEGEEAWISATWRGRAPKPRSRAARPMGRRSGTRPSPSPKQRRASAAAH